MEQEKIILLEKKNGVKYAVLEEKKEEKYTIDEKAQKLEKLLTLMIRQTVGETLGQYHKVLKDELSQTEEKIEFLIHNYEREEEKRWKIMEDHFQKVDKIIREKQKEGKRRKHSLF